MTDLTIMSLNTQGLGNYQKRRDVFQYLKQKHFSIYCLQDTHFDKKSEKQIRSEWGYECFFSSFSSQSRGVAILLNNNFDFKVKTILSDTEGNYLILILKTMERELAIVNIYGPNKDNPAFYEQLQDKIENLNCANVIIVGDWNLVLNPAIDYCNYKNNNNPKAQEQVFELMTELSLVDIWREINPETLRYTWRRTNPPQQSRLDFFLISENIVGYVKDAGIPVGYRSDHSAVTLHLVFKTETKCRNFWKFNSSLLKDLNFAKEVNITIEEVKKQYAAKVYNPDNIEKIPHEDLQLTISDQLFLDVLIMEIRKKCMDFGSKKKREDNKKEQELEQEISDLENKDSKSDVEQQTLIQKKETLVQLRKAKIDAIMVRSKATYVCSGEKVSKYYCNMEKRHFVSKQMYKLNTESGECLDKTEEMLKETKAYYAKLYQKKNNSNEKLQDFAKNLPKLTGEEAETLEGLITLKEASEVLKKMSNGKSPGTDGMTVEFFKFFWKQIGTFVVRSLNEGFQNKQMSITQREGIIVCLPKGDKPREFLTNWRPITLLNVTYKIGSACIANRLKTVLHSLIEEDQSGFVAGRYIGDNLRLIYDMMFYLKQNNKPGLLVSIDFEKAFDSISWSYMHTVLQTFGFKEDFCQWISAFYSDIKASVIVNGQASETFPIERGCRQGDPISPYLFILCSEVLACKIRECEQIKGILISDTEVKISQFADDTTFLLEGDEDSYNKLFSVLKEFETLSGLKLNYEKTCNVWLGSRENCKHEYLKQLKMNWNPPKFKILGLWFTNNLEEMAELNFKEKFNEAKKLFNIWSKRTSTPLGRVAILKSLILSKLTYLWILLPNPPNTLIQQIQLMSIKFIWDNKRDKIKRTVAVHKIEDGGINVPYIKAFIKSLKIIWLKKYLLNTHAKWKTLLESDYPELHTIEQLGPHIFKKNNANPFWKDVFEAYQEFYDKVEVTEPEEILKEPILQNTKFQIDNKVMHFSEWTAKNIVYVKDLVRNDGSWLSLQEFSETYSITVNFLEFYGCINSIKSYCRKHDIKIPSNKCKEKSKALNLIFRSVKGTQTFYQVLLGKSTIPTACANWEKILETDIDWKNIFKFCKKVGEIKLRWFQLKIINRILVTNSILKEMGIIQSNVCSFCKQEKDTVFHYLWDCKHVQSFWSDFLVWIKDKCLNSDRLFFNPQLVLFGRDGKTVTDEGFDFILLHARFFVYKCRINNILPTVQSYIPYLVNVYKTDKYVHALEMKQDKFTLKWMAYSALVGH